MYVDAIITSPYMQSSSKARLYSFPIPPLYALVTIRSHPLSPYEGGGSLLDQMPQARFLNADGRKKKTKKNLHFYTVAHPWLSPGVPDNPVFSSVFNSPASYWHNVIDFRRLQIFRVETTSVVIKLRCGHDPTTEGNKEVDDMIKSAVNCTFFYTF